MMDKILAIDYGTKRIGLAINVEGLAVPYEIVENDEDKFTDIQEVIIDEEVSLILVGMSENEMAAKTAAFVGELKERVSLPVEYIDETLSSQTVHQKLATSHMKRSKRQQPIDHYAAAEILQEWLEMNY